jgi:hypothetical protein
VPSGEKDRNPRLRIEKNIFSSPVCERKSVELRPFRAISEKFTRVSLHGRLHGGEGGIRTPDTLSGMPVFKTGVFNRSTTSPTQQFYYSSNFTLLVAPSEYDLSFSADI